MIDNVPALRLGSVLLAWAIPALASGVFITFSVNHAPSVGLVGMVILSAANAVARSYGLWRALDLGRFWWWTQGTAIAASIVAATAAVAALALDVRLGFLVVVVSSWAATIAVCDLIASVNSRNRQLSRDLRVVAVASGALALVEVLVPLTSVYAVGILGAYGIVTAVYLSIAGMSFRFETQANVKA